MFLTGFVGIKFVVLVTCRRMIVSKDMIFLWKRIKRHFAAWNASSSDVEKEKHHLRLRKYLDWLKGLFYSKGYFSEACKLFKIGLSTEDCVGLLEIKFIRHGVDLKSLVQYTDKDTAPLPRNIEKTVVRFADQVD